MQYERVIIRNVLNSELANVAANQLHNYFAENFKSLKFSFVTSGNHRGYMISVKSNQPIEDDTLALCFGYAVRVIEEMKKLFGVDDR